MDDLDALIEVLPDRVQRSLRARDDVGDLVEVVLDLGRAPEARFPTQIDETVGVFEALLAQGVPASRIAFAGDSCGGGIAVAAMCKLRDAGKPLPAGFIGLTPWFDLEQTGESALTPRGVDPYVNAAWIRARGRDYVGPDGDLTDPLACPLHADLTGLPPLFLSVGEIDTTRDDSTRVATAVSLTAMGSCGRPASRKTRCSGTILSRTQARPFR